MVLEDARGYLEAKGWREQNSPYVALIGYQASQRLGQPAAASEILAQAATNCTRTNWPYPIVGYLRHELSATNLLAQATNNDQQTEARCYLGLELARGSNREEGLSHLRWVEEKGNKEFTEYILAVTELRRLQPGKNVPLSN
jgi:lipoprotein NlpI